MFRATANRSYEWLDLGGGDGTSHAPYVLTRDVLRANPRTIAPTLNETLPGQFALGVAYGDEKDGSIHSTRYARSGLAGSQVYRGGGRLAAARARGTETARYVMRTFTYVARTFSSAVAVNTHGRTPV